LEEENAKTQGRKDARVVELPRGSWLFGRRERKDARAQRRKGSGAPAGFLAVWKEENAKTQGRKDARVEELA